MKSSKSDFGAELRRLRERKHVMLSQQDLAEELGYTNSAFISRIENSKIDPPRRFVNRLEAIESLQLTAAEADNLRELMAEAPLGRNQRSPVRGRNSAAFPTTRDSPVRFRQQEPVDRHEKEVIARFLVMQLKRIARSSFLQVFLDSGTTAAAIAYELAKQASQGEKWKVFSGNLLATEHLLGTVPVHLFGGLIDAEFGASLSVEAANELKQHIDRAKANTAEHKNRFPPLGVLSCLAFTPTDGPLSRQYELNNVPEADPVPSRHILWKGTLMANLPWLLVPLTYQKLDRPRTVSWRDIAGPIRLKGTSQWLERIRRGADEGGPITQIVLHLPESGTGNDVRLKEKLSWTLNVTSALIHDDPKETRFHVSTELVLPPVRTNQGNSIIVIDGGTREPISREQLEQLFDAEKNHLQH